MSFVFKEFSLPAHKSFSNKLPSFLNYSSYFVLSSCIVGFSPPACAMEIESPFSSNKIISKGFRPNIQGEIAPLYDKEREMFYYGKKLGDDETPENDIQPLSKDETGVIFTLSPERIENPLMTGHPLISPVPVSTVVDQSNSGVVFALSSPAAKGEKLLKREREEHGTFSTSEDVNKNRDSDLNSLSKDQTEILPPYKKHRADLGDAEEKILGNTDRRRKVEKPGSFPWSVHGHMRMEFLPGSVYIGSGTLIDGEYVITAAHNLFDRKTQTSVKKIQFFPGKDGNTIPCKSKATHFVLHPSWYDVNILPEEAKKADIAVVKLKKPLGKTLGYYGYREFDETDVPDKMLNITGYPGGTNAGKHMHTMQGEFTMVNEDRIYYNIDTSGGQSGSGIWVNVQDSDDQEPSPYVVGVHTYGSSAINSGTRLNAEKAEKLGKWLESLKNL